MATPKRRAVVSYENMSEELSAAFSEKYPKGFNDYFPDLMKYDKPDGSCFYAVTIEIPDDSGSDSDGLPDDNISQYSSGDDDASDGE